MMHLNPREYKAYRAIVTLGARFRERVGKGKILPLKGSILPPERGRCDNELWLEGCLAPRRRHQA